MNCGRLEYHFLRRINGTLTIFTSSILEKLLTKMLTYTNVAASAGGKQHLKYTTFTIFSNVSPAFVLRRQVLNGYVLLLVVSSSCILEHWKAL